MTKFQSPDERGGYCDYDEEVTLRYGSMEGFNPLTSGAGTATSTTFSLWRSQWWRRFNPLTSGAGTATRVLHATRWSEALFQSPDERGGYCDMSCATHS